MNTDERIAAIEAARVALADARAKCIAAGVDGIAVIGRLTIAQTLDDIEKGLGDGIVSAKRQSADVKIGDTVEVRRPWLTRPQPWTLDKVGRVWIRTGGGFEFSRDSGDMRNASGTYIHPDDLARINRCFPRKAGAK